MTTMEQMRKQIAFSESPAGRAIYRKQQAELVVFKKDMQKLFFIKKIINNLFNKEQTNEIYIEGCKFIVFVDHETMEYKEFSIQFNETECCLLGSIHMTMERKQSMIKEVLNIFNIK